ncbi:MAG: RNA polymerase sigma factor [Planctomycetota bacterium]
MIRFNRGDKRALRDIYGLYKDELVSLACALSHDKTAAQDAVHEVFANLISQQETLKISQNLRRYLISAVANAVRQHYRTIVKRSEVSFEVAEAPETRRQDQPESAVIYSERQQILAGALAALPYEQREVILLRHFSDLRFNAIAAVQNVSVNTVHGRYRYGLEKLGSLLNGELL